MYRFPAVESREQTRAQQRIFCGIVHTFGMSEFSLEDVVSIVSGGDEMKTRQDALDLDYTDKPIPQGALAVARVLLLPPDARDTLITEMQTNKTDTAFERLMDKARADGRHDVHGAMVSWFRCVGGQSREQAYYPIFLYNRDYARTREILHTFLFAEKIAPRYLPLFCLNLFRQVLGVTHSELHRAVDAGLDALVPLYNELFRHPEHIAAWMERKRQPLYFYGSGPSNMALAYNDRYFRSPEFGFSDFDLDADARYDIGGGFYTSEIERCVGRSFVSADITHASPSHYDDDLVIQTSTPDTFFSVADDARRTEYLERQERVQYLPFNVMNDSFPDAESYGFISTGFITSTVRAKGPISFLTAEQKAAKKLGSTAVSLYAIRRVAECAAAGKNVDFFTVMRATWRTFKYKTCHMQWRSGRLTKLHTFDAAMSGPQPKAGEKTVHDMIDPRESVFCGYF